MSAQTTNYDTRLQGALIRADLWRLISLGFHLPDAPTRERFLILGDDLAQGLQALDHPLAQVVADWTDAYRQADATRLEHEYHALFTTDVLVNPYEGGYQRQERGTVIGDVSAFYIAFGLVPEPQSGPPDSLWNQCAFLSWLSLKEAFAIEKNMEEGLEVTRKGAAAFLADHLARWVGVFCRNLLATSGHPVFLHATQTLLRHTSACLDDLGVGEVHPLEPLNDTEEEGVAVVCPAAPGPEPSPL